MRKKRILVVDDLAIFREPISLALEAYNYKVICAINGKEALAELEKNTLPFDLYIVDYSMPEMTGIDLLKIVRATPSWRDTPVIMLTDMADKEIVSQAIKLGITDYVLKSAFSLDGLLAKVNKLVKASSSETSTTDENLSDPKPVVSGQILSKTAEPAILSTGISTTSHALKNSSLLYQIRKILKSNCFPEALSKILALVEASTTDTEKLAAIVKSEPLLATRVLKMANSAAYSRSGKKVSDIKEAIAMIGFSAVANIAATASLFQIGDSKEASSVNHVALWNHAFATAIMMEHLYSHSLLIKSQAYLAGLCHDFPEMLVQQVAPDEYEHFLKTCIQAPKEFNTYFQKQFELSYIELIQEVFALLSLPKLVTDAIESFHLSSVRSNPEVTSLHKALSIGHYMANGLLLCSPTNDLITCFKSLDIPEGLNSLTVLWNNRQKLCEDIGATFQSLTGMAFNDPVTMLAKPTESRPIYYFRGSSLSTVDPLLNTLGYTRDVQRLDSLDNSKKIIPNATVILAFADRDEYELRLSDIQSLQKQAITYTFFLQGQPAEPNFFSFPISFNALRNIISTI